MDVEEKFLDLTEAHLGSRPAGADDDLTEDHGADSLDYVELSMAVEEEFNIMLGDDECSGLTKVSEWVALIQRKVGGGK